MNDLFTRAASPPARNLGTGHVIAITVNDGARDLRLVGREAYTLDKLLEYGASGLSSIEQIGPRISHYIYKLRKAGLTIETREEKHVGAFMGWHGRYVLHAQLRVVERVREREKRSGKGVRHAAA
jgi:hypothetical protein